VTSDQWLAAGLVLIALTVLIVGLRICRLRWHWQPETVRKLVHIGMGTVALTFPWIFSSALPVFVLASVAFVMLLGLRYVPWLKTTMGGVIDAVDRVSAGELYFPAGIALSFWLSDGDPLLYCVPILILTLADAVAALVGIRYGTKLFTTLEGTKSYQGSFAFFVMAFFCAYLPLRLYAHIALPQAALISLITGLLTVLVEAVAWRGIDNLLLPVMGFLLFNSFVKLDVAELATNLGVVVTLSAITFFYRSRSTFADDGLLTAVLVGYVIWALGGFTWVYPPLVIFVRDKLLSYSALGRNIAPHNAQSILTICLPGVVWLVAAVTTHNDTLLFPYVLTFAVQLAILELTREIYHFPKAPRVRLFAASVGVGWLLFVPYVLIVHAVQPWLSAALLAVVPIALGTGLFMLVQRALDPCPRDLRRWLRQGTVAFAVSAAGLAMVWLMMGSSRA
jgi:phytol kinase